MNHHIHLIPQEGIVFSWLPYNNIILLLKKGRNRRKGVISCKKVSNSKGLVHYAQATFFARYAVIFL